ncbi:hypothetical protein K2173_012710 [Erythroxylum novogranatense]|uniref:Cation/H+ exchanger domain-containing protein n=1 Tax=Erythroxylum novogranatense TaxID=1862640 RepID=A0AAV8TX29_9ROSI|nr:hypothetical protein K2173_012710 [Erythroxylum novogranatense]
MKGGFFVPQGNNRDSFAGYQLIFANGSLRACYNDSDILNDTTFWQNANPLVKSIPFFAAQLSLTILVIRLIFLGLNVIRQPRFSAELIAALMLGPGLLGGGKWFGFYIQPLKTTKTLETMGNLGLVYYMFLVGLEMELGALRRIEKKSLYNAILGFLLPFGFGIGYFFLIKETEYSGLSQLLKEEPMHKIVLGAFHCGLVLTVTSFTDLARVLSDIKLLHTDIGRTSLSSALVSDLMSWGFLVAAVTISNGQDNYYFSVLSTLAFIIFCWFALRPALHWFIKKTSSKEGKCNDLQIFFILAGVVLCGFITDFCGSQSMTGAFMLGLIMPKGELSMKLLQKLEDFVAGVLLPAFFLITGIRTNYLDLRQYNRNPWLIVLAIAVAFSAKMVSSLIISMLYGMPNREGVTLGVLMNTKGVIALIVLNAGRNRGWMNNRAFVVTVLTLIVMMTAVKPIPSMIYKYGKHFRRYKRRTLERSEPHSELRTLVCIHDRRNVSGMINLLEVSNPTKQSPICVFAVHLVELTGRSSAMMIVHDAQRNGNHNHVHQSRESAESEVIINAFERFEDRGQAVSVQPLTVVSPYTTMHEDICTLAEDKRVTLLLIPFHKQPGGDGMLQEENASVKLVNQNLLANAPCTIGLFIDRGLSSISNDEDSDQNTSKQNCAVIFIGGADDREALSYGSRITSSNNKVNLTIIRFVPSKEAINAMTSRGHLDDEEEASFMEDIELERQLDDEYINEFRFRTMCDESITYVEKLVSHGDEIITTIKSAYDEFDLYIVGRGKEVKSPLTLGISEWSEDEDLGALGDMLLTSSFAQQASILVIRQFRDRSTAEFRTYSRASGLEVGSHKPIDIWRSPRENNYNMYVNRRNMVDDDAAY